MNRAKLQDLLIVTPEAAETETFLAGQVKTLMLDSIVDDAVRLDASRLFEDAVRMAFPLPNLADYNQSRVVYNAVSSLSDHAHTLGTARLFVEALTYTWNLSGAMQKVDLKEGRPTTNLCALFVARTAYVSNSNLRRGLPPTQKPDIMNPYVG